MTLTVRASTEADLDAITAIYAENVLTGTGTFETAAPTLADMTKRRVTILDLGMPWIVAELDRVVVGYAYAGPFRMRAAYRYTVEDSVYVTASAHGRGVGKALLLDLIARCEGLGLRQMLAVIGDSENAGSVRLHATCGFRPSGTIDDVGWKFDRWLDVVFMQRTLNPDGPTPPLTPGMPLA